MSHPSRHFTARIGLQFVVILLVAVGLSGCKFKLPFLQDEPGVHPVVVNPPSNNNGGETTAANGEPGAPSSAPGAEDGPDEPFSLTLEEGQEQPDSGEAVTTAEGEPLSEAQIAEILLRLPDLLVEEEDSMEFNLPDEPIPPPRPGETIEESFPPDEAGGPAETVESGPLEVLRYAPEGEIPIAPFVNVTFNQPMVPLTTIEELSKLDVPVQVEPELPGVWKWIGTRTLRFEADIEQVDRLPMATEFTATIPKGTTSAVGGVLAQDVRWTFSTPPPVMTRSHPSGDAQPLEPLFFIAFDQRIDPAAVLETISVTADGKDVNIQLASADEIAADENVSRLVDNAGPDRWLAFKAKKDLPQDANIIVVAGPGTPSAEGPRLTEAAQTYDFYTYAPLKIEEHDCYYGYDECRPLSPLYIRFNNPIDADTYKEEYLTISPELPGAAVDIVGDTITIQGATAGSTTYKVVVDGDISDIFGQTLGRNETLRFKIGQAEPVLIGPEKILVTLDPAASKPALSLYTINYKKLDVEIYAVNPSDWPAYKQYLEDVDREEKLIDPPGQRVRKDSLRINAETDTLTEVGLDLSAEMDGQFGQFIVIVSPPASLFEDQWDRRYQTVRVWVQVTQIGLDAFSDHSELIAWATSLQDGAPLSGVEIVSEETGIKALTGEDGVSRFALPSNVATYLEARKGADRAILPRSSDTWYDIGWSKGSVTDTMRWFVFDDRQMYKPGEEVHLKGWLRRIGGGQTGDVGLIGSGVESVNYVIFGPQGNELGSGSADVNVLGGFDFNFTLPENTNLGYANIQFEASYSIPGNEYYHEFQIQEFRRPEFEVTARNETTGPYFAGGEAIVAVEAAYFAGGPLPNAETTWYVTSTPTNYSPPNWSDFTFGFWTPWWGWYGDEDYDSGSTYETFNGVTDASGTHFLKMNFEGNAQRRTVSVMAEASVMDVNRQAWSSSTSLMVHPADLYVGLRSERYFVERGEPLEIELIVTDLDGNPVADQPVHVTAARLEWSYQGGWHQEEVDLQECTVDSMDEAVLCTFETPIGGRYQITAVVTDEMDRSNKSQFTRWVSGGEQPPSRQVEQEEVTLIPDQETYQPGDVAEILVQSPFVPAEGLLTVSRSGILYTERFIIADGSITLKVPIEDAHIPNLHIQVDLVGSAPRVDDQGETLEGVPPRPAYASGSLKLSIPPVQRSLALEVIPQETEVAPGGETTLDLVLTDAAGEPVEDAELAVVVVDEAILALTNYYMLNPLYMFYNERSSDVSRVYGRSSIVLTDPMAFVDAAETSKEVISTQAVERESLDMVAEEAMMEAPMAAPMAEMAAEGVGGGDAGAAPIAVRSDFNPLATFAPTVRTDARGQASISVTVPDNLTRYRIMVVAVDQSGKLFGSGESNLTARLPLMVRPSAPRFLNFGDRFELPIVLQNQTDDPMEVDVVARASNISMTGDSGLRVVVPPRDRIEVRFPGTTDMPGVARFQIAAVSGDFADAAEINLPVYTPATTEAFATYGVIDEGATSQPVAPPGDVYPQFGGLEITTSSTALQALTDAVLYLVAYRFECSEQLSSRILAVSALRDVLAAFEADGMPSPEEMEAAVLRDIERLGSLQNYDGGFPYWVRGKDSIPFNTVHVAHALQRARMMDFDVPENMIQNVGYYLQDIESHYPYWYSLQTRLTISAYALYVRDLMGDSDPDKAAALIEEAGGVEELSLEALAWVWQVLSDAPDYQSDVEVIRRHINNRAVETPGAANFTVEYGEEAYLLLHSNRRTDAVILDALINDSPDSDLIPKVVNGLLAHRTRGRWGNTQENVFILLALDRYFDTYESQTPDFVARIWLGETYAGSSEFVGYSTERYLTEIPMQYLVDEALAGGTQDLILSKEGVGRLYYRLGMTYAPADLELDPLDMGFVVQRVYEAVDDPADVTQDEDGVWHIKAGARVRVRLTMVADNRRYHVALIDPLPAGLEIVNPALAVSGSTPQDPNESNNGWWWWWTWYEHQNMRDERAEAFTSLLWAGVHEYTYVARATTPGEFVAPPAKAEEMYSPEVFGRSGSDWVYVE